MLQLQLARCAAAQSNFYIGILLSIAHKCILLIVGQESTHCTEDQYDFWTCHVNGYNARFFCCYTLFISLFRIYWSNECMCLAWWELYWPRQAPAAHSLLSFALIWMPLITLVSHLCRLFCKLSLWCWMLLFTSLPKVLRATCTL